MPEVSVEIDYNRQGGALPSELAETRSTYLILRA